MFLPALDRVRNDDKSFTAFFTAFDLGANDLVKRDLASANGGTGIRPIYPEKQADRTPDETRSPALALYKNVADNRVVVDCL